ncbi:hypothetical protein PsYK624_145720 [Phanerochaete sordida]|uniref:Uncharacterized protein n=1 Tax=Phanerochaete sordida TaxID=48140 RepID=A0A9P3GS19_9APHY|nr:hypothetical protein PsYK624_145720 [Phanerochaete sordida]
MEYAICSVKFNVGRETRDSRRPVRGYLCQAGSFSSSPQNSCRGGELNIKPAACQRECTRGQVSHTRYILLEGKTTIYICRYAADGPAREQIALPGKRFGATVSCWTAEPPGTSQNDDAQTTS